MTQVDHVTQVNHVAQATLPTARGQFTVHAFREVGSGQEHVALVVPSPPGSTPYVRVHSECLTGDAFGSLRCDCGPQLQAAMDMVAQRGGAVVYMMGHEGRGIGIAAKVAAYALQDMGRDTVQANVELGLPVDSREYSVAADILQSLGLTHIYLLTNNPLKVSGLQDHGIDVVDRLPIEVGVGPQNQAYLQTKKQAMGHLLSLVDSGQQVSDTQISDTQVSDTNGSDSSRSKEEDNGRTRRASLEQR